MTGICRVHAGIYRGHGAVWKQTAGGILQSRKWLPLGTSFGGSLRTA